jgi:hypothetical protein
MFGFLPRAAVAALPLGRVLARPPAMPARCESSASTGKPCPIGLTEASANFAKKNGRSMSCAPPAVRHVFEPDEPAKPLKGTEKI